MIKAPLKIPIYNIGKNGKKTRKQGIIVVRFSNDAAQEDIQKYIDRTFNNNSQIGDASLLVFFEYGIVENVKYFKR